MEIYNFHSWHTHTKKVLLCWQWHNGIICYRRVDVLTCLLTIHSILVVLFVLALHSTDCNFATGRARADTTTMLWQCAVMKTMTWLIDEWHGRVLKRQILAMEYWWNSGIIRLSSSSRLLFSFLAGNVVLWHDHSIPLLLALCLNSTDYYSTWWW